jgi:uncharacterized membrane protein
MSAEGRNGKNSIAKGNRKTAQSRTSVSQPADLAFFVFLLYSLLRIVEKIVIMLTDTDNYLTIFFIYYIFMKKKLVRDHPY